MSEEPTRWRDDPTQDPGLASLDELYRGYALPGVPKVPPTPPWRWWWGGGGVGVALALVAAWWFWPVAPTAVVAPETAPAVAMAPPQRADEAVVDDAPVADTPVVAVAAAEPPKRAAVAPAPVPPEPPTEPAVAVVVAEAAPPKVEPTWAPGTLDAELREIGLARERLEEADHTRALAAFDAYLAAWPDGRFRAEARLGRLDCLVGLARWSEVAALAGELLDGGEVTANRRPAIEGQRARALVLTGRCPEALVRLEFLEKADQGEIRKACR